MQSMHFSSRTEFGSEADPLTEAVAARRRLGLPVFDLSESNPTRCGLQLPADAVLSPLASPANLHYAAEPLGPLAARATIAEQYYGARGIQVAPAELLLTASTSEAYSFLFRLFCEPGDHVLVPQPSYPLFDLLARLGDVETRTYPLRFHERWEIDMAALEASITERTRAIVVVHPNNPTGHYAARAERLALDRIAAGHGLPLLVDEVFLDYPVEASAEKPIASFAADRSAMALTLVMSGLSKVLALPQMKLAWTLIRGPEELRREALHRLEFVADTFLSVASPAAHALPCWLEHTTQLQDAVRQRVAQNLAYLDQELATQTLASRLPVEGGWSVLLRVPAVEDDNALALQLLDATGVLAYPGSFFGLPRRAWFVLSLLPKPEGFASAVQALLGFIQKIDAQSMG